LIDFQHEYSPEGRLALHGLQAAAHTAQGLAHAADRAGVPVIHVHHVARQPGAAVFAPGTRGAMPLPEPAIGPTHAVVIKHWPSAFQDTDLAARLQAQGIGTLVITGCMTHNCVDSTARAAMHLGFTVAVVPQACATRGLPGPAGGQTLTAQQVHETSLAALADRHARLIDASAVLAMWQEG
jgi:nicotinamidase-related amidase